MTEYKFILKKDLEEYEEQGWEYVKDIDQFIISKEMKQWLGFEECLVRKESENELL